MFRKALICIALALLPGSAFAACVNPLSIKDGGASSISMSMSSNGDGFCQYNFNMAQINGVAPLMGNGVTGTGSPRVTISSDNTPVAGLGAGVNGSANPANSVQLGMSDGTNLQKWLAAIALADGVNGNNTGAVASWLWNGTTYDRQRGDLTNGAFVNVKTSVLPAGAATSANQGTTADVPCTLPATATTCSEIALAKAIANAANSPAQLAVNVTPTDCSSTVVTGGTAVNAFTAQTTLHGFTILNDDTSEVMWISFTTTAAASTAGSYPLAPATATSFAGANSFTAPPGFGTNHALSVVAATNGHKFSCTWW